MLSGRRRYMGKRIERIPYQRVEYLENSELSEGLPYIDTEYMPNGDDIDIYVDFQYFKRLANGGIVYSTYNSSLNRGFGLWLRDAFNSFQIRHNTPTNPYISVGRYPIGGEKLRFSVIGKEYKAYVNGTETEIPINDGENANNKNLIIFDNESLRCVFKVYSFRLDKAGERVLDLVPVRIDDVGYMYDRVSGRLFGNAGSGKFLLGPDIK